MSTLGLVGVRQRHHEWNEPGRPLKLALGAGAPGEAMGTFGADVEADQDEDAPTAPPARRAFKLADAFVLIDQDELLICTDGGMRGYGTVSRYFRALFDLANLAPAAQAFDFEPASNQDKRRTLEQEGVGELTIKGTMYAATQELEPDAGGRVSGAVRQLKHTLQELFSEDAPDEEQREILARHWGDINVVTTISPAGGKTATPVVLSTVDAAGEDMIDEVPDDSEVHIRTRSGNLIKSGDVILTKLIRLRRKERQNDLDPLDVWQELDTFREELRQRGAWQR
ncbi:hypothetical protein [Halomonas halophila]|nr:hypothetical protein [Halomonas halophila]WJY06324.1 hypothetical protein QWG60_11460 [Halomonas halophila]